HACAGLSLDTCFVGVVFRNEWIEDILLPPGIRAPAVCEGEQQSAARFENSQHLPDCSRAITQRIDHAHADNGIEKTIRKRKAGGVAGNETRPALACKMVPANGNHSARRIQTPKLATALNGFGGHDAGAAAYVENPAAGLIEEAHYLFASDAQRVTGGRLVGIFAIVVSRSGVKESDYRVACPGEIDRHFQSGVHRRFLL